MASHLLRIGALNLTSLNEKSGKTTLVFQGLDNFILSINPVNFSSFSITVTNNKDKAVAVLEILLKGLVTTNDPIKFKISAPDNRHLLKVPPAQCRGALRTVKYACAQC